MFQKRNNKVVVFEDTRKRSVKLYAVPQYSSVLNSSPYNTSFSDCSTFIIYYISWHPNRCQINLSSHVIEVYKNLL